MRGRPGPTRLLAVVVAATALQVAGCAEDAADPPAASGSPLDGPLTVSAAASLTESFTEIAGRFESAHPDVEVELNFGSSGQLSTQIGEGAPADVAAFADTVPMDRLARDGLLVGEPRIFAENELVIVTEPGNPGGIGGLADLPGAGVVALCVDTAPCGTFADQVLDAAGVEVPESSVTRGQDVRSTLAAVSEGDAVAGIVYVTDAAAAGDAVDTVAIPGARNVVAGYPVAVVADSANPDAAAAFVAFVLGTPGRAVLEEAGFLLP